MKRIISLLVLVLIAFSCHAQVSGRIASNVALNNTYITNNTTPNSISPLLHGSINDTLYTLLGWVWNTDSVYNAGGLINVVANGASSGNYAISWDNGGYNSNVSATGITGGNDTSGRTDYFLGNSSGVNKLQLLKRGATISTNYTFSLLPTMIGQSETLNVPNEATANGTSPQSDIVLHTTQTPITITNSNTYVSVGGTGTSSVLATFRKVISPTDSFSVDSNGNVHLNNLTVDGTITGASAIPVQAVNGSGNIIASTLSNTVTVSLNASVTPTASVIPQYDGNANLFSNNEINSLLNLTGSNNYTLTAASPRYIYAANGSSSYFTLPATNNLSLGEQFTVFNFGGGSVQMNISSGTSLFTIPASYSVSATFMVISTSSVSATSNWAIMYNAGYTGGNISVGSATSTLTSSLYNAVFGNGMSFKTGLNGNSTTTDFNFTYNSGLGAITNTSGSHSLLASSGDFAATTGSGNYYELNPAPVITQSTSCTGEVAIYKSSPLVTSCNSKFMLMDLGCNNVSKFATDSAGNNYITSNFTTVSGSSSGTAIFNEPDRGGGKKTIQCYSSSLNGTASYTFPVAFTYAPVQVAASSGISATVSSTSVTVTGTGTSGWIIFEGY